MQLCSGFLRYAEPRYSADANGHNFRNLFGGGLFCSPEPFSSTFASWRPTADGICGTSWAGLAGSGAEAAVLSFPLDECSVDSGGVDGGDVTDSLRRRECQQHRWRRARSCDADGYRDWNLRHDRSIGADCVDRYLRLRTCAAARGRSESNLNPIRGMER